MMAWEPSKQKVLPHTCDTSPTQRYSEDILKLRKACYVQASTWCKMLVLQGMHSFGLKRLCPIEEDD